MPTRLLRKSISHKRVAEVTANPCVVCGIPFNVECDHVIAVTKGGGNEPENLQPLCYDCNHKKHNHMTNDQLLTWVAGRGEYHFIKATHRWDVRYQNFYERKSLAEWSAANPERLAYAKQLAAAFLASITR